MPVTFSAVIPVDFTIAYPTQLLDEWETTLKGARDRIRTNLGVKIPNQAAFNDRIADASSDRWGAFLQGASGPFNYTGIKLKQRIKLAASFPNWQTGVTNAFNDPPTGNDTFRTNVTAKKSKMNNAKVSISAVGFKPVHNWQGVSKAVLLFTGDERPLRYPISGESISGTVQSFTTPALSASVRPVLMSHSTQGLIFAHYAHSAGLATERDTVIADTNTNLDQLVNSLKDTAYAGTPATHFRINFNSGLNRFEVLAQISTP